jgi:hypothetical protein
MAALMLLLVLGVAERAVRGTATMAEELDVASRALRGQRHVRTCAAGTRDGRRGTRLWLL